MKLLQLVDISINLSKKTHKAVSGASYNSKNVEKQSNFLNSNVANKKYQQYPKMKMNQLKKLTTWSIKRVIQKAAQITKELLQSINEVSAELKKNAQSV